MIEKAKIDMTGRNYYQTVVLGSEVIKEGARTNKRLGMIPWNEWFKGKTVLDIGSNNGMFSLKAAESGAKKVVGVDWNTGVLLSRRLAKEAGLNNVTFCRIDLNRSDFYTRMTDDFDVIFFCAMLRHIKDKPKMLEWIDIHCRERLIFETNLHEPPTKILPFYKKHTSFQGYDFLGKSGDVGQEDDYHLYYACRNNHERGALENKIPITWVPKENVFVYIGTVENAKKKGQDAYERLRNAIDKLKENIIVNGLREPMWVVPDQTRAGHYKIKQGGHRLLALKELDEYFDIPVRIIEQ